MIILAVMGVTVIGLFAFLVKLGEYPLVQLESIGINRHISSERIAE